MSEEELKRYHSVEDGDYDELVSSEENSSASLNSPVNNEPQMHSK